MFDQLWYFFVFKREVKESVCHYLSWLIFLYHNQMLLHSFTAACLLVNRADMLTDGQTHARVCEPSSHRCSVFGVVTGQVELWDASTWLISSLHGPWICKVKTVLCSESWKYKELGKKLMKSALSMWSQLVQFNSGNTHKWLDRFLLNLILPLMFLFLSPCYLFLYYAAILPVADFWWTTS